MKGYEKTYLDLLPRLAQRDIQESAERLGLDYDGKNAVAHFLGRDYLIGKDGVEPADAEPVSVIHRGILAQYILSNAYGELSYEFSRNMGVKVEARNAQERTDPLRQELGENYTKFVKAAHLLHGKEQEPLTGCGHYWLFHPLPKVPTMLHFLEADDEFPSEIHVMSDEGSLRFIGFETIAFLWECLIKTLVMTVRHGSVTGWHYDSIH